MGKKRGRPRKAAQDLQRKTGMDHDDAISAPEGDQFFGENPAPGAISGIDGSEPVGGESGEHDAGRVGVAEDGERDALSRDIPPLEQSEPVQAITEEPPRAFVDPDDAADDPPAPAEPPRAAGPPDPPKTLTTQERLDTIKAAIKADGFYMYQTSAGFRHKIVSTSGVWGKDDKGCWIHLTQDRPTKLK